MKRNINLFIQDILEEIKNLESFSKDISKNTLEKSNLRKNASVRSLEIIDEAVKNIPDSFRKKYPEVEWKKIAGLRDRIIHAYFDVDIDIIWNIIKKDIPDLKKQIQKIKKEFEEEKEQ